MGFHTTDRQTDRRRVYYTARNVYAEKRDRLIYWRVPKKADGTSEMRKASGYVGCV